jgi:hypothetical protein
MPRRLHRIPLRLTALVGGLSWALTGCNVAGQYRVKTSQPWPDEWVSGARVPYERLVQLTSKTVEWHRKANWTALEGQVVKLLAQRRDVYGFVRTGSAQAADSFEAQRPAVRYLEVKFGPCFFDFEKPPPKVTLDYKSKPFADTISDLMARAHRSFLISPLVAKRPPITAHLANLDWREAAVRVMLDADVFVEPVWYNPVSLRSYEYESEATFMAALTQVIEAMKNPAPEAPVTVVPWEDWVRNNQAYQLRQNALLRSAPTTRQLGPPSGTAILSSDLGIAKKQILYALPYQLNRPPMMPSAR